VAGTNTNFENVAGLYHPEPILGQHGSMQESIAGPIEEFDEAEAFLGNEPPDRPLHWRAGWCLQPGLAEPGSGAENTRVLIVGISVESATPRITEILISHRVHQAACDPKLNEVLLVWCLLGGLAR
jgi:hypothetical protein